MILPRGSKALTVSTRQLDRGNKFLLRPTATWPRAARLNCWPLRLERSLVRRAATLSVCMLVYHFGMTGGYHLAHGRSILFFFSLDYTLLRLISRFGYCTKKMDAPFTRTHTKAGYCGGDSKHSKGLQEDQQDATPPTWRLHDAESMDFIPTRGGSVPITILRLVLESFWRFCCFIRTKR